MGTIPGTIRGRLGGQNSRLAVESKVFPLYEVENGEKWTITVWPRREVPVQKYLQLQGRFSHLAEEDIEFIQGNVDREWERLVGRASQ
jgi:pyruvate/2-oxoacid:ferredoxin oxidoreductase beta subunit